MIRLLPSTDAQIIAVIPREFPTADVSFTDVSLTITEDGTNKSETITDIEATVPDSNSNFVYMDIAFSILSEESAYYQSKWSHRKTAGRVHSQRQRRLW